MLRIVVVESEQENGGLAVSNLRIGQLLRFSHRCSAHFTLLPAIPRKALIFIFSRRLLAEELKERSPPHRTRSRHQREGNPTIKPQADSRRGTARRL